MKRSISTLLPAWLLLLGIFAGMPAFAQEEAAIRLTLDHLQTHCTDYGITPADVSDVWVTSAYSSKKSGITHVYFSQQHQGIEVLEATGNANIDRHGALINMNVRFVAKLAGKATQSSPAIAAEQAVRAVADRLEIALPPDLPVVKGEGGPMQKVQFAPGDYALEPIQVRLAYFKNEQKTLSLVWEVQYYERSAQHHWTALVDAAQGKILSMRDDVLHCEFGPAGTSAGAGHQHRTAPEKAFLTGSGYNVYPMPVESPNHGDRELVPDPSNLVASPYGWHDFDGAPGADTTITFGNNVHAYHDSLDINAPSGDEPDGGPDLLFDYPLDLDAAPGQFTNAAVTNLFYWNNIMHDVTYQYGFDEPAGNFQYNNYGNGGMGGDYVRAEAQDGGGTDNANFYTSSDGDNGRMQMYLWYNAFDPAPKLLLTIESPAGIQGSYLGLEAVFGPPLPTDVPITGEVILVNDGTFAPSTGCNPLVNAADVSGKIALIDRGGCSFPNKVLNAQNANAIAVIVCNNDDNPPIAMPGIDPTITIPSIMISKADCQLIKVELANGVTASLLGFGTETSIRDGDLDNGIICHEYAHGISNRLTGGPNTGFCLNNAEQMGEGWSDYFTLIMTMEEGDLGPDVRGIGTFAIHEPVNGPGIRPAPYSTDMGINPYTYAATNDVDNISEPHGVGFVWCTMLWDMTWMLIDQHGFDPDIYNGTGGNNIALQLVMDGMKLQPCDPGFIDGRDAILLADQQLYDGAHQCLIWEAFAKRGLGVHASQGSNDSRTDQVENFDVPNTCLVPDFPPTAAFVVAVANECAGKFEFEDQSTDIPHYYFWDFGDGNTSEEENPAHTYDAEGTYIVTLIVTNTLGADTVEQTVIVDYLDAPVVETFTACKNTPVTLTAPDNGYVINWYENGELVFSGAEFVTPPLTGPTTYLVEAEDQKPLHQVGPPDNSFGGGGYHNTGFTGKILFEAYVAFVLDSVWVDAGNAGDRYIQLFDEVGNEIDAVTVFIPQGQSMVALKLEIPSAGKYQVGGTGLNLYRNNNSAQYPYVLQDFVTLTSSNATGDPLSFYYYFYNWKVREPSCFSPQAPVEIDPLESPVALFDYLQGGAQLTFVDGSTGATSWLWDFGDGHTSTEQNPAHFYLADGDYEVILTVSNGNCESTYTQTITIVNSGVGEIEGLTAFDLYPTIGNGQFLLTIRLERAADLDISVVNVLGQEVFSLLRPQTADLQEQVQLPELASGAYFLQLKVDGRLAVKRYVLMR